MALMQHPISEAERLARNQAVACTLLDAAFQLRLELGTARLRLHAAIEADDGDAIERATADIAGLTETIHHLCAYMAELGGVSSTRLDELEVA